MAVFACAIFVVDTFTKLEIAVPVLYVAVIVMASRFGRREILVTTVSCIALTVLSYSWTVHETTSAGVVNTILNISTILVSTFLLLQGQAADVTLQERANLLDLTHDSIFVRDMNDVITYWNRGAQELYGWTRDEAVGRVSRELMRTTFPAPIEAIRDELLRTGRWEGELKHTKRDQTQLVVASRWSLQRDKDGRARAVLQTNNDITERKRAEQRLSIQHKVTGIVAESAILEGAAPKVLSALGETLGWDVGALWRVDREASVLRCVDVWHKPHINVPEFESASRETTFLQGIGLPGRVWFNREPLYVPNVVRDANFPRAPFADRELLQAGFGFPIMSGGEVVAVLEFFSREIREPDQDLLDMVGIVGSQLGQFIERKRAEEGLVDARAQLTHLTRISTLGEMSASIAHEINQPLGAIANNASASLRWLKAQNLEETRKSIELAIEDAHRAAEIIGRIRSFARKTPPLKDWIDINQTVREAVALARNEMQRHNIALETRFIEENPSMALVFADRIQVQQLILNLMMNAIEAMSETNDGRRRLEVRTEIDSEGRVVVSVKDSGPGLKPENVGRLFTPFYTTKAQGMGLGLAICRSIVEAHGGRLWATNNKDHGATFQFTLPVGDENTARLA